MQVAERVHHRHLSDDPDQGERLVLEVLDEKVLKLEIADKVRVDISRNAVVGYQGQEPVVTEAQSN